jgi:hypothetical protein
MANENELNELRERIGRLSGGEQVWLLEAALADNRRRWAEEVARQKAAVAEFVAEIEAQRELDRQRENLAGEKRAAG